jgi:hypothetical protein
MSTDTDVTADSDLTNDPFTDRDRETIGEPVARPDALVEVRRRAGLAVVLGAGASLVAIAYLARAISGGGMLDWVLFVVLGAIGAVNLAALLDARTPLLVADDLGVRLRLSRSWVGLPWGGLQEVEHRPQRGWQRGWWRDGLLVVRPHYVQHVLEELDASARRTARVNRRLHRAALAVPLGLATRTVGAEPDLTAALRALADGRTPIVETAAIEALPEEEVLLADEPESDPPPSSLSPTVSVADVLARHGVEHPAAVPERRRPPDPRPALARWISDVAARLDRTSTTEADVADEPGDGPVASATPEPARETAVGARVEVRQESRVTLDPFEEETQVWADLHAADDAQEPAPLLIDAYAARPADEPVIGPEFAASRARLGLSVDELADRTRIRPHVIEAIEVDDFSACGGDFYARGHLRTLARVLGLDVAPLLESYDERYADAPIDPRRVFEAELAGAGSIRGTRGGPNWSVLVAAVMALILCWSVARLVTGGPDHLADSAVLSGSGGPNHTSATAAAPVSVTLTAAGGGARVVVRSGTGTVAFSGELAYGQEHTLRVSPPVRIQSSDGAVRVRVAGQDRGPMGPAGRPASASYVVRR